MRRESGGGHARRKTGATPAADHIRLAARGRGRGLRRAAHGARLAARGLRLAAPSGIAGLQPGRGSSSYCPYRRTGYLDGAGSGLRGSISWRIAVWYTKLAVIVADSTRSSGTRWSKTSMFVWWTRVP